MTYRAMTTFTFIFIFTWAMAAGPATGKEKPMSIHELSASTIKRSISVADLDVPDSDRGPSALHAEALRPAAGSRLGSVSAGVSIFQTLLGQAIVAGPSGWHTPPAARDRATRTAAFVMVKATTPSRLAIHSAAATIDRHAVDSLLGDGFDGSNLGLPSPKSANARRTIPTRLNGPT